MSTLYVVGVNGMSMEEDKKFAVFLREHRLGWWHWIDNFWIVVDSMNEFTSENLRVTLNEIAPDKYNLIFKVEPTNNWSGFGPTAEGLDMFDWLRNNLENH